MHLDFYHISRGLGSWASGSQRVPNTANFLRASGHPICLWASVSPWTVGWFFVPSQAFDMGRVRYRTWAVGQRVGGGWAEAGWMWRCWRKVDGRTRSWLHALLLPVSALPGPRHTWVKSALSVAVLLGPLDVPAPLSGIVSMAVNRTGQAPASPGGTIPADSPT